MTDNGTPEVSSTHYTGLACFPYFYWPGSLLCHRGPQSRFSSIPESEGIYLPSPQSSFGSNTNEATGKSSDELVADYRERYDEAPTSAYLTHAYNATTILLRVIEDVAVADRDTLFIDRARLREALTSTAGFSGIVGAISCDEFGDCGTGRLRISHHTDSSVTDVAGLTAVYRFAP